MGGLQIFKVPLLDFKSDLIIPSLSWFPPVFSLFSNPLMIMLFRSRYILLCFAFERWQTYLIVLLSLVDLICFLFHLHISQS